MKDVTDSIIHSGVFFLLKESAVHADLGYATR